MKKQSLFLLIIIFLLFALITVATAKEKKASNKAKTKASDEKIADPPVVPFDMNAEKLPPNYRGTDIIKLYSMIAKKVPLEKNEFETTAEYEKNKSTATADISGNLYAFKLATNAHGHYGAHVAPYDADAQRFIITLESDYSAGDSASFIIKRLDKGSNSYIGSNAFGAKRLVTNYRETQYGIALVSPQDFGSSLYDNSRVYTSLKNNRTLTIEIKLTPEKARVLKDNIGVLLLCKPNLPNPIFEQPYSAEATIDDPVSLSYDRKYINVEVLAIWIYDIRTGEVISKTQLKNKDKEKQDTKT